MKVVAIAGSNGKDSNNKKLLNFMKVRYDDKLDIEILDIGEMPMYNQDNELNPPDIVKSIKAKIKSSDGILISTPEYNHSIPGILKNALDWFSRVDQVMIGKPAMVVGVSMGNLGTVKAQMHLREILNSGGIGTMTLPGNEVFIGTIQDKIDESGKLVDEGTIKYLDSTMDNFIQWVEKIK